MLETNWLTNWLTDWRLAPLGLFQLLSNYIDLCESIWMSINLYQLFQPLSTSANIYQPQSASDNLSKTQSILIKLSQLWWTLFNFYQYISTSITLYQPLSTSINLCQHLPTSFNFGSFICQPQLTSVNHVGERDWLSDSKLLLDSSSFCQIISTSVNSYEHLPISINLVQPLPRYGNIC